MQHFLFALGTTSLTMSLLAMLYILITPMLIKRYSAKWRYYSWLIIVIGLIIPFRPHFDSSLMYIKIPMTNSGQLQLTASSETDITGFSAISYDYYQNKNDISGYQIIGIIWIIGVIIMSLYYLYQHIRFLIIINRWREDIEDPQIISVFQQLKDAMGISSNIALQQCACSKGPLMIGFVRPIILLPITKYSYNELSLILRHELVHIKRRDLLYKIMVIIVRIIHWFNPVVYKIAKEISLQCELSCDEAVIQNENILIRKLYGQTILNAAKHDSKCQTILSTNFYGGVKDMKSRIFSILDTSRKKKGIFILCFLAVGLTATGMVFAETTPNEGTNAYESNIPVTKQEQSKINEKRKQDITEQYSIYEQYGLTYDSDKDRFFYNGEMVRFFTDTLDSEGNMNSFIHYDGIVDINATRNKQYVLTGIEAAGQAEYDQRTITIQSAIKNNSNKIQENMSEDNNSDIGAATEEVNGKYTAGMSVSNEAGNPDYADDSLNEYLDYGISYNMSSKQWFYGGKPIHYLTDGDNRTYVDNNDDSIKNGVLLKVIRSDKGGIEELIELNEIE